MRHDAQEAGVAHLRALGFEACALFYNVSAAYLALLQPAAALPYLCQGAHAGARSALPMEVAKLCIRHDARASAAQSYIPLPTRSIDHTMS